LIFDTFKAVNPLKRPKTIFSGATPQTPFYPPKNLPLDSLRLSGASVLLFTLQALELKHAFRNL
jgi:hypothetical protein